jgi:mlo protein
MAMAACTETQMPATSMFFILSHASVSLYVRTCRVVIQLLCSYSTLPLYAIVTQVRALTVFVCRCTLLSFKHVLTGGLCSKMGSYYKKEIFNEHVQQGVLGWAQKAKKRSGVKEVSSPSEPMHGDDAA